MEKEWENENPHKVYTWRGMSIADMLKLTWLHHQRDTTGYSIHQKTIADVRAVARYNAGKPSDKK